MIQSANRKNRAQTENVVLHFTNGNLQFDERTSVPSNILGCKATIYSDEYIGVLVGSDATIGYNETKEVWVEVNDSDGNKFEWGSWEDDRKVAVLFYVLTYDREYLLYCNEEDFFCYLMIPKEDPRQEHTGRLPNTHLNTTYKVLDGLLKDTNEYVFKCVSKWFEG